MKTTNDIQQFSFQQLNHLVQQYTMICLIGTDISKLMQFPLSLPLPLSPSLLSL